MSLQMPPDVPLLSMPIAQASAGGLVQPIFSSPSRITISEIAALYCRDAKLKMLCAIRSYGISMSFNEHPYRDCSGLRYPGAIGCRFNAEMQLGRPRHP
jgi:hypothetical protein